MQSAVLHVLRMDTHIVWDRRQLLYATALAGKYSWVYSRAIFQIHDDVGGFLSPGRQAVQSPSAAALLCAETSRESDFKEAHMRNTSRATDTLMLAGPHWETRLVQRQLRVVWYVSGKCFAGQCGA